MNKAMRSGAGLSMIGLWLVGAVNRSYAQDACLDARVTASDGGVFQSFGYAVAVYGDTALIGAQWDNDLGTESGSVYVFRREGGTSVETQKLLASDGYAVSHFGTAVAIEGDLALIGAFGHQHDGQSGSGSAYVFRYDGATWLEEQELFASDGGVPDNFGISVSLSGDIAVIGARLDDDNGANSGSAYVFRFDPETQRWVEEQKLLASDGVGGHFFGQSVAVQGDLAIIGANGHDDACRNDPICDSGAAYVFRYDPKTSTWIETQKLLASDAMWQDSLGDSVALFDDVLVIGAHATDDNGFNSGSAYVFRFDSKTSAWIEEQKLLASDGAGGDQLGRSVAIDGDTVVVGASASNASTGAAYVFRFDPEALAWIEQAQVFPQPNAWTNFYGRSVAIDGETAVIGAHGEDQQRGASYIYNLALNCNGPHDFNAFRGFLASGTLDDVLESDDDKLCYNPGIVLNPTEAPVTLDFFGTLPNDSPSTLDVTIESSANTVGLELTVSFWNYNTSMWDIVGTDTQSLNADTVRTFAGNPADHVEGGTGEVRTRYEVRQAGIVFLFPWTDCVDHVFWTTTG